LVYVQGLATTKDVLRDDEFGVSATAIKLIRQVSMYQWQEHKKTETKENIGGTTENKTTYSYRQEWSNQAINSNNFRRSGHNNPSMPYKTKTQQAREVMLGAFKLNSSQISRIDGKTDLSVNNLPVPSLLVNKSVTVMGSGFYLGNNPNDPQIGDIKVSFQVINPTEISLVARQQGNHFSAYQTEAGGTIDLLKNGMLDANAMFAAAQQENTIMTWVIRIGGTLMMWIGLGMVFRPLAVVASVLPFLGNLMGMGTSILAFLITLPCAMITIALAWIAYRPLLAGGLIAVAVLAIVAMKFMPRKHLSPVGVH